MSYIYICYPGGEVLPTWHPGKARVSKDADDQVITTVYKAEPVVLQAMDGIQRVAPEATRRAARPAEKHGESNN